MRRLSAFVGEISGLGRAFVDVLQAEWSTLTEDLGASGRLLVRGLVLFAVAAGLLAWAAILMTLALVALLARWLEPWMAAALVAAAVLLIGGLVLARARSVLHGVRAPARVVQARVRGHLDWLGGQLGATEHGPTDDPEIEAEALDARR